MGNLALTFPDLSPSDFAPWVDESAAAKEGKTVVELATATADLWKNGLADHGIDPERIRRLEENADAPSTHPAREPG
jgi:hypothetical protein